MNSREGGNRVFVLRTDTTKSAETGRWSLIVIPGQSRYVNCSTDVVFECTWSILSVHAGFRLSQGSSGGPFNSSLRDALDVVTKLVGT